DGSGEERTTDTQRRKRERSPGGTGGPPRPTQAQGARARRCRDRARRPALARATFLELGNKGESRTPRSSAQRVAVCWKRDSDPGDASAARHVLEIRGNRRGSALPL